MSDNAFYITTPIYYVNDIPHLGTAYCTLAADARARFERLRGKDVRFLTGTDENALKVARAAEAEGKDVQTFVDELAERFKETWRAYNISFDDFIRTTEPRHTAVVQRFVEKLYESGDIYMSTYSGWYCVSCETFFNGDEVKGAAKAGDDLSRCPNAECRKEVQWTEEPAFYFRLSAYADRLLKEIEDRPDFLRPESRRNETMQFIKSGLNDVCISRVQDWGIPMPASIPGAQGKVIYVWYDALINYASAVGLFSDDPERTALLGRYWPADLHLVGKDIFVRFHATLWPAMLMSVGVEVPRQIFGTGFWNIEGEKMSKSKGNVIEPVHLAKQLAAEASCDFDTAVDAIRYFLLKDVSFGSDGDFRHAGLVGRYNGELANDLGNLLNRTLSMVHRYRDGRVPGNRKRTSALRSLAEEAQPGIEQAYAEMNFVAALSRVIQVVREANRHIEREAPWEKVKSGQDDELDFLLTELLDTLQFVAIIISPVLPSVARKIWAQLGSPRAFEKLRWEDAPNWGILSTGVQTSSPEPVFPRVDTTPKMEGKKKQVAAQDTATPTISFKEFQRLELRTATVTAAEKVDGADKLLKLTVDAGDGARTVVAGIAQQFAADELVGKNIVIVANLEPATIRGVESRGMILAAGEEVPLALISPDRDVPPGTKVR